MAHYRKRGDTWTAEIRRKGFAPIARTFDRKADAEKWASKVEAEMLSNRYVDTRETESLSLSDALDRYAREVTPNKRGAARELGRITRWRADPLASKSIAALRSSDLAAWRDAKIKIGLSPNSVRLELALISHLYTIAAKEWGLPVVNPCANIRKPSAGPGREVRMSPTQETAILAEAAQINPELPAWIVLAVETGMRRGEVAGLRWEWIKGRVARLPLTKNGSARDVPLSPRALAVLSALPRRIDGRVLGMNLDWMTKAFAVSAARAGCPEIRFHDLRHEATSRFFEQGLEIMEVAAITGHKTLVMLRRYTHMSAEMLAEKLAGNAD